MKKTFIRILVIVPVAAVQVLWLMLLIKWLTPYSVIINFILSICAFLFVLYIITKRDESTYKILWLLVILLFPLAGAVLYLFYGNKRPARLLRKRLQRAAHSDTPAESDVDCELASRDIRMAQTFRWLENKTKHPVFRNEDVRYYSLGDEMFPDMLEDLRNAEKYIYVEYFIISHGLFWDSILEILEQKAREGVDVRVMYDDLGSISTYTMGDVRELQEHGIKCTVFNPLVCISGSLNYRDHRKMMIIDGKVAFTGGINLSDEYINRKERFGHWKDTGFRISGKPVESFTVMFRTFWNAFSKHPDIENPSEYESTEPVASSGGDGYVLSYCDSPLNAESTSTELYIDLLSQATDYAWFYTPYLMPGDDLMNAMIMAAQRGVDVRIMMPGIPDKKLIFRMSHSFYQTLLLGGVKIYEYEPGFLHAKAFVTDDRIATVGSVNLDHRSLFLHFENNSLFYGASLVSDLKQDFLSTQEKCREIKPYDNGAYVFRRVFDGILRLFAPLC